MQEKSVGLISYTLKSNCHFKRITEGCKFGYELPDHCHLYYVVTVSIISKNIIISTYMPLHMFKNITIKTIFPENDFLLPCCEFSSAG
jgi:hypothetical protein